MGLKKLIKRSPYFDVLMNDLIQIIIRYAYPVQESIKSSDFAGNVKNLTDQIITIFRKYSLQYVPPFLNGILACIEEDAKSEDKRRRYASAVCVSSLILLFPFDDYIPQYSKVTQHLLVPGYRPIVQIGAIVAGRIARIAGFNRDNFLRELVDTSRTNLRLNSSPDVRYTAAVIWSELAKTAPEIFFSFKSDFHVTILDNLQSGDRIVCELLIEVIYSLFKSEAASIGSDFLIELQDLLITATTKNFQDTLKPDEIIIYFQLLQILLKLRPYLSKKYAENLLLSKCVNLLKYPNFEIVMYSVSTIVKLEKIKVIKIDKELFDKILLVLFEWAKRSTIKTISIFEKVIFTFPKYLESSSFRFLEIIAEFYDFPDGPLFAYNLIVAAVASLPPDANISHFLSSVPKIMAKSSIPTPIHRILNTLNKTRPKWTINFVFFKNQMLRVIRQELSSLTSKTDRLMISLLALTQIPNLNLADAMELNSLIITLTTNKDIQVREMLAEASIHLFSQMPDKIPLKTINKLVSFALDDPSRSVRLKSLKAFKPITYKLLAQPDIFPLFCRFAYDESPEIKKEALFIFSSIPIVTGTIIRNILLSSLKQISSEHEYFTSDTIPMWMVFPRLIVAATPWLEIYAEALFEKFMAILEKRFTSNQFNDKSLIFMNSALYQDIDESLIKSIAKLHQICPDLIPMKPILNIFCKILIEPAHPWTKIHVLKSLKNLGTTESIIETAPQLFSVLFDMIQSSNSQKLIAKAMKVIGSIGFIHVPESTSSYALLYRNSLVNPKLFKNFFVSTLIGYLNNEFLATNLDSKREAIAQVITSVFKIEQEMVPHFIEPFLSNYLKYIEASSERHSIYFHYLRLLIESSGHLILPKSKLIYDSIQKHWHSEKTTKEASKVFCSLVVATMGRCEIILHNLVSESFLLLKVVDKSQMYAQEVFAILEIIAKLSPSYLSTIIAGIIEFLSISSVPQHLQTCSLQAIDFLVKYCQVGNRISAIKRCLSSIMQRSQARFREKANQIMNEINSFSRSQSLENLPPSNDFNEANNPNSVLSNNINSKINNYILNNKLNHSRNPKIIHIESINKYLKLPKELNRKNIINWFYELLNFLLNNSPSEIIQTMTYLDQPPKFAFKFAFIQMWIGFDTSKQREIARCLEKIFRCDVLPEIVLYKFIELIEFSFLCEIDLGVMIDVVIKKCVLSKHYSKALFFLESYIMYNPNIEISKDYKKTLVLMNNICGREYDARAIAIKEKEIFGHDVWMALGEWELALSCLKSVSEPDKYIGETVICHAALDDWKSIKDLENKFSGQSIFTQTRIAQYFWNAESFCGKNENAITYTNMTGGYSVDDSIEKAILLIKLNRIEEANKVIHLGWRYVGASISSVEKSNVSKIKNLLFRAEQLHELTDVINLIRDPNHSKTFDTLKTAWQYRLKLLKDDPLLQKEVFKIRSLCKDYSKASCEDLDDLSFHILYTTSRSHFSSMIPLMIKVFFPNIESEQAKLCKILYEIPPNEALTEAKELLKHTTSSNLSILISDFVGKKMARNAKSLQDLEDSLDFLLKSNCSNQRLSKIYSLLAYVKNDPSYAEKSVELISKQTTKLTPVQLHHVLALLVGFKVPIKKLLTIITEANSSILKSVTHTALTLLGHKDEKVVKSCLKLMTIICNNFPQFVALDLINNDNLPHVQSLLLILQKDNPTITSQIMTLSSKFTSISNNLYETWIDSLNKCINFVQERKFNEANNCLSSLHSSLEEITSLNLSKYDQEFIDFYYTKLIKVSSIKFENIIRESNLNDEQNSKTVKIIRPFQSNLMEDDENISKIDEISSLVYTITKKLDSNRIIPLSFLDGLLERKNNWILYIFGSSDVKLSKIYNRLQRLDNGFKVSFIGSNGKKYNFHLLKQNEPKVRLQESEQFINLLNSMTSACDLVHRSVIQLSPNTLLIELLKGHLALYDLVTLYESAKEAAGPNNSSKFEENNTNSINDRKSSFYQCNTDNDDTHAFSFESYDLGNNIETHYVNVEAKKNEEKSDIEYKSFEYQRAQKRLKKMQISQYESTLAKAIVVTSKNAMAWIQRTSMFAKSYGVLSAVSYIVGNVDTSPSAILFDKVSGAVTYTQFTVSGEALPIPFRLTKMIVGALGSSGVNGQFRLALESSIKRTRRFKSLIAPCLQFFVGEAPFDPIIVPQKYNKIYAIDKKATNNNITENKNEDENKCTFEDGKSSSIQYFDQIHEIDLFYERINGEKDSVKDDVDVLIEKASDINSMMKMPRKWISWW